MDIAAASVGIVIFTWVVAIGVEPGRYLDTRKVGAGATACERVGSRHSGSPRVAWNY